MTARDFAIDLGVALLVIACFVALIAYVIA